MRPVNGAIHLTTLGGLCLLLVSGTPALAEEGSTAFVEGTVLDVGGETLPDYRIVARVADGVEVFISPPTDAKGRYGITLPSGRSYLIVALIAPSGARVALPESEPLRVDGDRHTRNVRVPAAAPADPGRGGNQVGGADRLFLSFVEDTALVDGQYWELQIDSASDNDAPDLAAARVIAAFRHWELPRVEFGARAGYGEIRPRGAASESGALDLELWGKFHLHGSPNSKWELAAGALMTLPIGDEDSGLGRDAAQSELFFAASCSLAPVTLIGHVGVVTSENGEVAGLSLEGQVAASGGLGLIVPLSPDASLVFEADYDGARFEETDTEARLLSGFNWRLPWRGKLRAAIATGLADASPDAELIVSYAVAF
jgi:hypothetical protein